jgi:hypothetical protein
MTAPATIGRHDAGTSSRPADTDRWAMVAVVACIAAIGILGGSASAQRFAGVFLEVLVWATPFVVAAAVLAGLAWHPRASHTWKGVALSSVLGASRVPWAVSDAARMDSDTRRVIVRTTAGFVMAPTVVFAGLVEPGEVLVWVAVLAVALVALMVGGYASAWPRGSTGQGGRHDSRAASEADDDSGIDIPSPMAGIVPRPRTDFVSRCADITSVSLRLTVIGAGLVAVVTGLPPDSWVVWVQARPLVGIVLGLAAGILFPPVPEAVAPAMLAFAPLGAGAQVAFGVSALVGNAGLQRRMAGFVTPRVALRFGAVVGAIAVAAGGWGSVLL